MKWFSKKSTLDEMQELKLLKLESRGFWIGFIGLFLVIAAQVVFCGRENMDRTLAGEFIVFLCMGIYLIAGCLRNGIWDRHLSTSPKVNIGISVFAAAVTALFNALISWRNYQDVFAALSVFAVCFLIFSAGLSVTLCVCSALYRRRRNRLEEESDDSDTLK